MREIEDDRVAELRDWANQHKILFPTQTAGEAQFVSRIFSVPHFQQVIEKKKLLKMSVATKKRGIAAIRRAFGIMIVLSLS